MFATISRDLPGARRLRRYAPILVALGLAVAAMAPGLIAENGKQETSGALTRIGIEAPNPSAIAIAR